MIQGPPPKNQESQRNFLPDSGPPQAVEGAFYDHGRMRQR